MQSSESQVTQSLRRRPASETDAESHPNWPHDFELEPHGLFILHPPHEILCDSSKLQVEYAEFNIAGIRTVRVYS